MSQDQKSTVPAAQTKEAPQNTDQQKKDPPRFVTIDQLLSRKRQGELTSAY